MTQMDHTEATQQQTAIKYVLGELSQVQRDAYEEHYFDCAECAIDIKALATFADTARETMLLEGRKFVVTDPVPAGAGWFAWLKPIVAVPAFAALLLIIAYQNAVTIPHAREDSSSGVAQLFVTSRAPRMAVTRGSEDIAKYSVRQGDNLPLNFHFTPTPSFVAYFCPLHDESTRSLLQLL